MPTTYTDQFFFIDPFAPPPVGTALTSFGLDIIDQNDNGLINRFSNDSINGSDITRSYPGDTITVTMGGASVTITGVTFYLADGTQVFTPNDGTILRNAVFESSTFVTTQGSMPVGDLGPPCFAAGTLIATDGGDARIDDLVAGDLVQTMDHGLQPIRWIGHSRVNATGRFAPVLFAPGTIGNETALSVSPQHRILVQGWRAELYFGCNEVLVPAKHLIDGVSVVQDYRKDVTYFHLLFDCHEIIFSGGALSESFFPGDQVMLGDAAVRAELLEIFPALARGEFGAHGRTARPTLKRREAQVLSRAA